MRYTYLFLIISALFLVSCEQKVDGIILDKSTNAPIENVTVMEYNPTDSYPHPYTQSNKKGFFSFVKKKMNSIVYFSKLGYKDLRIQFDRSSFHSISGDTIYLIRQE